MTQLIPINGSRPYKNVSVSKLESVISNAPCKLIWLHIANRSLDVVFLKLYDASIVDVTVGVTVPVLTFLLENSALAPAWSASQFFNFGPSGIDFKNGVVISAVTGPNDTDTGAPADEVIIVNAGIT